MDFEEPIQEALFRPATGALGITQKQGAVVWFGAALATVIAHGATRNIWVVPWTLGAAALVHVLVALANAVAPDFLRVLWDVLFDAEVYEP